MRFWRKITRFDVMFNVMYVMFLKSKTAHKKPLKNLGFWVLCDVCVIFFLSK